ncbi:UDP-N-acetylmuramoyl-L-alanyl-D-glutamate--2,6-diaminopimelate ligase [Quadrisphaera sp. DSM 44207]|uniref:UDP-N-acetylmuramoyl-L-alanyl-D-glutamate--2, 6-diaminopimelate ligase n=1 Tax=Quadrisphaera sp. DSM 44207 TaxID=1881057 RepID=UPI00087E6854|nr:UDP-N-acetylmuramoyl-L-alanyl-D-glutamate--2,6-diaminopimelate ligase [Quadrisphaera sp. DSM 44207]SDQ43424.1 UDP-N-acetylmuramoylalanyl-D-glutamate--2,6-diaminopimelate ligase [Quadrisphaera sp. DSM 44207]
MTALESGPGPSGRVPPSADPWRPVHHRPKRLAEVARALGCRIEGPIGAEAADAVVTGTSQDSRAVLPGDLYAALPGARVHGARFVPEALARGAVAVLGDRAVPGAATLVVRDPRAVLGPLSSWVYDHPSQSLDVYGVTGTNGKTSTTHLLEAGLAAAGRRPGIVGGVVTRGPQGTRPSRRTTPEADELHASLASLRERGSRAAAVEVSSHGLVQHRVDGVRFAAAVFTNLGRDHLDFHGDLESYFAAKAALFEPERCALAVVGTGDEHGRRLARSVRTPVVTFGCGAGPRARADWWACDVAASAEGTAFRLRGPGVDVPVRMRLLGAHQVDNAVGAVAALASTGVDVDAAVAGIEGLGGVPGRLERVEAGQPFLALVDYAHNPAGQRRVLPYLRSLARGRLIVVLGATGGRDPGKRAPLGRTAGVHADTVVVTDESPHGEDPAALRDDVAAGARSAGRAEVLVEPDRERAIALAVSRARPGDVLVVAGRGADQDLVAAGRTRRFDDRTALHDALRRRAA